jgi:hypothetical protein
MADAETLRVRIYRQLADEGRVDRLALLAADIDEDERTTAALLADLEGARHVVLDRDGAIELAHPFATRDFGFSVKSDRTLWWGGCAWDSFAIPNLVPGASPSLVATTCPGCRTPHAWMVGSDGPPPGDQVAHFLVPMAHVWDDVVHTCENQRIFCSERCVEDWLARTGEARGDVFDLATLWRLASEWYTGRLEPGYRRREPAAAAAYFRDAGLSGPFWGG